MYRELERLETAGRCGFRDLLQRGEECSIEGLEAFRSERHRGCEMGDVFDFVTGVALGVALVLIVDAVVERWWK